MIPLAIGAITLIGKAIGGVFGYKKSKVKVIQEAVKVFQQVEMTEQQRTTALGAVIAAEANSGFWLAACWRPLMMMVFMGMVVSYWFGYVPEGLQNDSMPPMVAELFMLIKIGLGGYIVGRSGEKVASSLTLGKLVNGFTKK